MPRDAAATRAAILAAATAEFAASGLAGGRIQRIASASRANPKSIYSHFGSKEALFDAAVTASLGAIGDRVPFTPQDLPGYAGRLFDEIMRRPESVRLNRWRQLERPGAGPDDTSRYREAANGMPPSADPDGTTIAPGDVLVLALSLPSAWIDVSRDVLRAADGEDAPAERIALHRAALVEAVRRIAPKPVARETGQP